MQHLSKIDLAYHKIWYSHFLQKRKAKDKNLWKNANFPEVASYPEFPSTASKA
jgi:hypothetical protein